ncbi:hypothetical protein EDD86DRAFT_203994 [Gorgonomyces haynaldii]|nr:hypothetical protein EDD86DRAFT_203994 [Gorgonomyces haynaldii]
MLTPWRLFKKSMKEQWHLFLDQSTAFLFPTYYNKVTPLKQTFVSQDIVANLPFQMMLYYSALLYPFFSVGGLLVTFWKVFSFKCSVWHTLMIGSFYGMFIIIEPFRLWLGYDGNLNEKVPNLSGCFLLSMWQFGIITYLGALQHRTGGGFYSPYEHGMCFIVFMLLISQMVFGYKAAKRIMNTQTVGFYMTFDAVLQ